MPASRPGTHAYDGPFRGPRESKRRCQWLRMRSWFALDFLDLNGGLESLVTCKAVNITPVLAGRLHIDNRGDRHPVRFFGIAEMNSGVVDLAAHGLEPNVAQGGFHGNDQLDDGAGLRLDPDSSGKRDGVVFAAKLHSYGRGSPRHGLETNADVGDAIHRLVAAGLKRKAGLIGGVNDE